jgi:hypothetical protein
MKRWLTSSPCLIGPIKTNLFRARNLLKERLLAQHL